MNMLPAVLLTSHLVATAAMVGLIWFVQVVHYPLFAAVGSGGFAECLVRTNWVRTSGWSLRCVIVALMVVQVVSS